MWSVEWRLWSVECGVWGVIAQWLRGVKCGVWSVECEVESVYCGVRSVKCGVESGKCGVETLKWHESNVWSVECDVGSVECEAWSGECEVRNAKYGVLLQTIYMQLGILFNIPVQRAQLLRSLQKELKWKTCIVSHLSLTCVPAIVPKQWLTCCQEQTHFLQPAMPWTNYICCWN